MKLNFSKTNDFNYFYDSHDYIKKKLYPSHKFCVDLGYEDKIIFEAKQKV